uniref:Uncharacterized protein n=1 Tax=Populus alba TaxID=43335 RepID=A0A4V6A3N7_POPAL|nr:hypothetical protein D5086_0000263560 [Populus alba]
MYLKNQGSPPEDLAGELCRLQPSLRCYPAVNQLRNCLGLPVDWRAKGGKGSAAWPFFLRHTRGSLYSYMQRRWLSHQDTGAAQCRKVKDDGDLMTGGPKPR